MQRAIRILLLAEPATAELIAEQLRRGGLAHETRRVAAEREFVSALKEFKPEIIVGDEEAPGWSAQEALTLTREFLPAAAFILLVTRLEAGDAAEVIQRGAADCVVKKHLAQLVPAVLGARREAEERKQRRQAELLHEMRYQQLSLQNEAVRQSEERFRQLAETIREVFWMSDAERSVTLYISPAYEQVWGRTCASLHASPRDWLEGVHPDDYARIASAALTPPGNSRYDEEYRVIRPDGSLRWIHDRAFPVRDESGAIYRIAGVAEDVTARKNLERQVLEISEREQERIGRDLHDELCQLLVGIGFKANLLAQDLERAERPEAAAAQGIGAKLTAAIKMARDLAHGLCPVNFQRESLARALAQLARDASDDFGVRCAADCSAGHQIQDPSVAAHVYRIAREAVHNAIKHGKPTEILVRLSADGGRMTLQVKDNGCGIPERPEPGPGLGLEIMKHRASMLAGTLEIRSLTGPEGQGTMLICSFPENGSLSQSPYGKNNC